MKWSDCALILALCAALSGVHLLGKIEGRHEAQLTVRSFVEGVVSEKCGPHGTTR